MKTLFFLLMILSFEAFSEIEKTPEVCFYSYLSKELLPEGTYVLLKSEQEETYELVGKNKPNKIFAKFDNINAQVSYYFANSGKIFILTLDTNNNVESLGIALDTKEGPQVVRLNPISCQ